MSSRPSSATRASTRARSWLYTPGTVPERFGNAAKSGADVLILDIEDGVAPALKATARTNVIKFLSRQGISHALAVRINPLTSRTGLEDIAMLLAAVDTPQFVVIPKVESPEQVIQVSSLLTEAPKDCALIPMIESRRGIAAAESIARADHRVTGLMFGAADYASSVRAQPGSLALQSARAQMAGACADADVLAIDAPCFALRDADLLRAELSFASANGFEAKSAVHPSHITAINETFTPSPQRLDWAQRVVAVMDQGVGTIDGRMVDEAIAREARRVLARAT